MNKRRLLPRSVLRRVDLIDQLGRLAELDRLASIQEGVGRIEGRQLEGRKGSLSDHEYRVYSHAGEDGILQFLTRAVSVPRRVFIEFGVEDYREANTRFLLTNDHWSGLVIDGDPDSIEAIRRDPIYWNEDLRAIASFVTRENINALLAGQGISGDIGLLSVDVDGNDYWILDAIEEVSPAIAVVEYNHRFGPERAVTIPYNPDFVRNRDDLSWLFCGASLRAISLAAARKGLSFVGCASFGNNAFFVRTELLPEWLPTLTVEEGFQPGRFRESVRIDGREFVPTPSDEQAMLDDVELVSVE